MVCDLVAIEVVDGHPRREASDLCARIDISGHVAGAAQDFEKPGVLLDVCMAIGHHIGLHECVVVRNFM